MPKKPLTHQLPPEQITVEIGGKVYTGTYRLESSFVRVSSQYGDDKMQATATTAKAYARFLLKRLVEASLTA